MPVHRTPPRSTAPPPTVCRSMVRRPTVHRRTPATRRPTRSPPMRSTRPPPTEVSTNDGPDHSLRKFERTRVVEGAEARSHDLPDEPDLAGGGGAREPLLRARGLLLWL